jgi:predicted ABC-class ATPase
MRELVRQEPITPFVDLVGPLHRSLGVSTIVVVGGVGDYLDVADRVILLEDYAASDATERAREVVGRFPPRAPIQAQEMRRPRPRRLRASSLDLRRGKRETARGRGLHTVELGRERVDLSSVGQLAEAGQTEAAARIVGRFAGGDDEGIGEAVEEALAGISREGLDRLGHFRGHPGAMSLPRAQEVAAVVNRFRGLGVNP